MESRQPTALSTRPSADSLPHRHIHTGNIATKLHTTGYDVVYTGKAQQLYFFEAVGGAAGACCGKKRGMRHRSQMSGWVRFCASSERELMQRSLVCVGENFAFSCSMVVSFHGIS